MRHRRRVKARHVDVGDRAKGGIRHRRLKVDAGRRWTGVLVIRHVFVVPGSSSSSTSDESRCVVVAMMVGQAVMQVWKRRGRGGRSTRGQKVMMVKMMNKGEKYRVADVVKGSIVRRNGRRIEVSASWRTVCKHRHSRLLPVSSSVWRQMVLRLLLVVILLRLVETHARIGAGVPLPGSKLAGRRADLREAGGLVVDRSRF